MNPLEFLFSFYNLYHFFKEINLMSYLIIRHFHNPLRNYSIKLNLLKNPIKTQYYRFIFNLFLTKKIT